MLHFQFLEVKEGVVLGGEKQMWKKCPEYDLETQKKYVSGSPK